MKPLTLEWIAKAEGRVLNRVADTQPLAIGRGMPTARLRFDDEANAIRAWQQGLLELVSPARPDM